MAYIRLFWGLTYDQIAFLFNHSKGKIYNARQSRLSFTEQEREFELWLHEESLQFTDMKFLRACMTKAHQELNGDFIQLLIKKHNYLLKKESVFMETLEAVRINYSFDVKAYAALCRIEEQLPEHFENYRHRLTLLKKRYHTIYSTTRFQHLHKHELLLARIQAEKRCIEQLLSMEFSDPDGVAK